MSFTVYSQPEAFGLQTIGEVDWGPSNPYGHDVTVVWKDVETGQLYIGSDEGCSCDVAFNDKGRDKLTKVDRSQVLIDVLLNTRKNPSSKAQAQAAELVLKAKREFRNWQARQRRAAKQEEAMPKQQQEVQELRQAWKESDADAGARVLPEQAAHVLGYMGQPGGFPPGDWTRDLLSVMDRADFANSARLRHAFPGYGDAIHMFKYDPDGVAKLQIIATTPAKKASDAQA